MKSRPISHHVWLAAALAMLVFIFVQSLLPPALSSAESGRVAALIGYIFGEQSALGSFLITYVRKLAHLTEFAILGVLVARTFILFFPHISIPARTAGALAGFAVGFVDETLQIFTGRGPMIVDVWIDGAGFIVGYLLFLLCLCLHERRKKKAS